MKYRQKGGDEAGRGRHPGCRAAGAWPPRRHVWCRETVRKLALWAERESLRWVVVGNKAWAGGLNGKQRSEHLGWELTLQPLSEAERHPRDGRYVVW